ncbi:MAG: metalloregulator ArsR/SmtB family transcription factor [Chloroflexi bacterium]|nr:metalloregulator ArsR/SmtB family transcription factor [Chloroflexota bacterium]
MNSIADPIEFARALSDRTRQEIMKLCCCEWRSVGELADELDVTQPTVSHHLAFLRDANLVHIRPEGRKTFYALNQDAVASCCGVLMLNYAPDVKEPT